VACIGLAGPAISASEEELALARLKASTSTFTEDYAAAIPPLELLVKNNDADAQNTLGSFYIKGLGVKRDATRGLKLIRQAAEQENASALFQLGILTIAGEFGIISDKIEGADLIRRSANGGDTRAMLVMAMMNDRGEGVPKDATQAHMWANIGSAYDDEKCKNLRDQLEQKLSRAEIAESNRMSREWFTRYTANQKRTQH
jgi:TPR repeat protein